MCRVLVIGAIFVLNIAVQNYRTDDAKFTGDPVAKNDDTIIIKKYTNRRLYNTATSSYVTLENLVELVREEKDFIVRDAKTGADLTHNILTQIIVDEEAKGQSLLPTNFLKQLIRFYGQGMHQFVPSYLELSLESLTRQRERYQEQFGSSAFEAMQSQARQNLAVFEKTLSMFSPFAAPGLDGNNEVLADGEADEKQAARPANSRKAPGKEKTGKRKPASGGADLTELQSQFAAMQKELERLAKKSD